MILLGSFFSYGLQTRLTISAVKTMAKYRQRDSREMYDLSQIDSNSRSYLHDIEKENGTPSTFNGNEKNNSGCYVSSLNGFILTFLVFVLVALVGVIVHFAGGNREVNCRCLWGSGNNDGNAGAIVGGTTQSPTTVVQSTSVRPPLTTGGIPDICKELAETGQSNLCPLDTTVDMVTHSTGSTPAITMTTGTASTTPTPEPEIDVRLPTSLHPYHYTVRLRPHIYGMNESEFYFEGYVKIDMTCIESTSEVMLHMKDLTITENGYFSAHTEMNQSPLYAGHTYDARREFLIISLTNQTTVGLNYSIELNFTGPLTKDLTGLYLSSFERDNKTE
ncbi:hypothetical protein KUTeg_006998 [Tegillarca granosa]|uniref:Aminopeptidase N-like N-terminal domain-containing protein n=1 Tax=Tegillarca granosa TaxID=220873 RepID=A0ABQ9FGN5_TEGGR|nr:hypothetical protein KUTeg_006998 [Tegillarca granosa]